MLGQEDSQFDQFSFDFGLFDLLCLSDEMVEFNDFLPDRGRVAGYDHVFQLGDDLLLFVIGQFVEVIGQAPVNLILAVGIGVG